ncbi:MAG: acylneuraminate cytidylyltransferase family protein [Candidatus Omnitrophica bacterium]|nr:acylneuraminate cytidylyltransferase family protein [Candidatus Omnitrophota bacterium]
MHKNKKILCLIPARDGSKGIPKKNIKPLMGKPLIAWTIGQAKKSKYIDRIIVSTDSEEIAGISRRYGAQTPFLRPEGLSRDSSTGMDVILHAIGWMEKNDKTYDLLIYLQPTSPLRTSKDIDNAIELLFLKKAQSIISVCEAEHHPYLMNILPKDKCMKGFIKKGHVNKNRQELAPFYRLNGAIFLSRWDYIKQRKSFFGKKAFAYVMPAESSIDIDKRIDFKFAEFMFMDNGKKSD